MLVITTYPFPFFQKKEIWFYDGAAVAEGHYTVYCYAKRMPPRRADRVLSEETSVIDLRTASEELYRAMNRTTRYHIRKAARMSLEVLFSDRPSASEAESIAKEFNQFASGKQIRQTSLKRILALATSGNLVVSTMRLDQKEILKHVYLHDGSRVHLMHTFHDPKTSDDVMRGFANKYLHWMDILHFQEKGFHTYDLGGINQEALPGITRFKLSFGGVNEKAENYICVSPWIKPIFKLYKLLRPGN